jgi:hypothetical protein
MKRQVLLLLSGLVLAHGCVLDIEVLDGVADDSSESDESSTDAESSSTDDQSESSSSEDADDWSEEESSSSTDDQSESSSSTDDWSEESSSSTDAESSSSEEDADDLWIDCAGMEDQYEEIVAMTDCREDSDCKIIEGHCAVGLGGCYYAVNQSVDETELADLAEMWTNGSCHQGVCDCPETPESAFCDAGTCTPAD